MSRVYKVEVAVDTSTSEGRAAVLEAVSGVFSQLSFPAIGEFKVREGFTPTEIEVTFVITGDNPVHAQRSADGFMQILLARAQSHINRSASPEPFEESGRGIRPVSYA